MIDKKPQGKGRERGEGGGRSACGGSGGGILRDFALRDLKAWAEELGLDDAAELLQETLEEERPPTRP